MIKKYYNRIYQNNKWGLNVKNKLLITISLILLLLLSTFISAYAENFDFDTSSVNSNEEASNENDPMYDEDNSFIEESISSNNESIIPSEPDESEIIDESIDNSFDTSIEDSYDESSDINDSQEDSDISNESSNIENSVDEDLSEDFSENESLEDPSFDESKSDISNESIDESTDESKIEDSSNESLDESFDTPSTDESISDDSSSPEIEKYYSISVTQTNGGKVQISKTSAKKGETITINITENNGYDLFSISVNGKTISRKSFIMPESDVEIVVKFIKIQTNESDKPEYSEPETSKPSQTTSKDENNPQDTSKPNIKYYNITTFTSGEGNVTVDKTSAEQGTRIIVTVKPDAGYKLEYIEFNGNKITEIGEKYAFVMPSKNVTIKVSFIEIESESSDEDNSTFEQSDATSDNSIIEESNNASNDESIDGTIEESNVDSSNNTSSPEFSNENSIEISQTIDISATKDDPSSPLLFIVPIIISLAMVGSIATFFVRKYGNQ